MELLTTRYTGEAGWTTPLPGPMDGPRTLVLAFAAPEFGTRPQPFAELAAAFPQAVIAGCSTSGEIAGTTVSDSSISVAIARFEHTELRRAFTSVEGAADSFEAGVRLAEQLKQQPKSEGLRAVFLLSDGLNVNGTRLVESLSSHLPEGVIITGGLAGDGGRFQKTWILDREQALANRICAIGFYGERLRVGHGCDGGWSDFGPERLITRSEGNVLFELDGKPALQLYKTYLGERAEGLPGTGLLFPLAVRRAGQTGGDALVRTILAIDEAQQSLTFAGDMPQGGVARLMRANTDRLIGSAGKAACAAGDGMEGVDDSLMISVSCVGRRLVLGERTEEEVEIVEDSAPRHAAHVGFYSYGEISPPLNGGVSDLHNQTMTVTMLSED
ncbi:MAG TPA: FIST N-terminal domain-containing protein [Burkholderiaceae bacterium]|jgi:hypothetical protein